jgi:motility quorum-sensing regulator / GCU-specific mRNA interferase toxin
MVKQKPHHDLTRLQARFGSVETLSISTIANRSARVLGFGLQDVVDVVQSLEGRDFVKSETAHSPPNSKVWHDSYVIPFDGYWLYLKFAGETLVTVSLTSFKEK